MGQHDHLFCIGLFEAVAAKSRVKSRLELDYATAAHLYYTLLIYIPQTWMKIRTKQS